MSTIDVARLDGTLKAVQDRLAPEHVAGYEGLPELLKELGRKEIPLAVLTSGSRYHVVRNYGVALQVLAQFPFLNCSPEIQSVGTTPEEKQDLIVLHHRSVE